MKDIEMLKAKVESLNETLKDKSPVEVLSSVLDEFEGKISFATSLGAEDQVITDMLTRTGKEFELFSLDTGRVFPEAYTLIDETNKKYGINIEVYFPNNEKVEEMVAEKGINLFYDSIDDRKRCCAVRKLEPLSRAFDGLDAWICGLRKDQTVSRFFAKMIEWDGVNNLVKVNPLIDWTEKDVWSYIKENNVPYNPLHDEGFVSIGCQPCTRAIKPGEDFRAGRWWWEQPESKECGLHQR